MNKYNLFALLPNNSEEQLAENSKNITELMQKFGVVVVTEDKIGKRKLAFSIKKARHAFYTNYILDLENVTKDNLNKMWRELHLLPDILRFEIGKFNDQKNGAPKLIYQDEDNSRDRISQYDNILRNNVNNSERLGEKTGVVLAEKKVEKAESLINEQAEVSKSFSKANKISIEELDQKLDDILSSENV